MIEMHIHISLDKDTDAVAEGAKLKELLNTALVGDFSHVCSCGGNCQEEDPNQVKLSETCVEEETEVATEVASEEPKKKKEKTEVPKIKIEDVRAVLSEYKAKGGDLKAVLAPYGANLPSVKESDYPALLKDAQEALSKIEEAE